MDEKAVGKLARMHAHKHTRTQRNVRTDKLLLGVMDTSYCREMSYSQRLYSPARLSYPTMKSERPVIRAGVRPRPAILFDRE